MSQKNRKTNESLYKSVSKTNIQSHSRKKKKNDRAFMLVGAGIIVILVLVIAGIWFSRTLNDEDFSDATLEAAAISEDTILMNAAIDLSKILGDEASDENQVLNIQGLTPAEITKEIENRYTWSLKLVNQDAEVGSEVLQTVAADVTTEAATMGDEENPDGINDSVSDEDKESEDLIVTDEILVPDFISEILPDFIKEIVNEDNSYKESVLSESSSESKRAAFFSHTETETSETEALRVFSLSLNVDDFTEEIEKVADEASSMWYIEPKGGSIGSYDKSTDSFAMENSSPGFSVDREKLVEDIRSAIDSKDFNASIKVSGASLNAESNITVGDYSIISTYTTTTSANAVRNKNIKLACDAINGTILRPGEEFSFNNVVGERTEEKGYGAAAAYNNGEVVQEVGGGVCQVSTTLYNAVVRAGLKTTMRQSHTFKPTYVTPGMDATVSWGSPDYKFANTPAIQDYSNDETYAIGIKASYANNKVTVSIYSRPVLKTGYEYDLKSTKTKDLDLVRVLIQPGDGREPTSGSAGSVWDTNLVITKDGEVISDTLDHKAYYSGHTEYYYEYAVVTPPESIASLGETAASIGDVPVGPGFSTSGNSNSSSGIDTSGNNGPGGQLTESPSASSALSSYPNISEVPNEGDGSSSPDNSNASSPGSVSTGSVNFSGPGSS